MLIWKHELPDVPVVFDIQMPRGAKVISVGVQSVAMFMWFAFDDENASDTELRRFNLVFTGIGVVTPMSQVSFIGTAQLPNGMVYHLFEVDDG